MLSAGASSIWQSHVAVEHVLNGKRAWLVTYAFNIIALKTPVFIAFNIELAGCTCLNTDFVSLLKLEKNCFHISSGFTVVKCIVVFSDNKFLGSIIICVRECNILFPVLFTVRPDIAMSAFPGLRKGKRHQSPCFDYKLFSEIFCKKCGNFHINTVILAASESIFKGSNAAFVATTSWSLLLSSTADITGSGSPSLKYLSLIFWRVPSDLICEINSFTFASSSGWFLSTPKAYSSWVNWMSITLARLALKLCCPNCNLRG